jgi:hypothetical protein
VAELVEPQTFLVLVMEEMEVLVEVGNSLLQPLPQMEIVALQEMLVV